VAADAGTPVRRAVIRISSPDIGSKTAMTDSEGRYEFRDLPAGRFSLSASKAGYVAVQYGQTRPFEQGKPIDLAEGQAMDKADFTMPRGSVISGRLVDEFGDPMSEAMVMAMRSVWGGGRRRLQPTGRSATTNDLGQFRIYGLSPGDYYVSATMRGGPAEMIAMEMAMSSMMGGGASGGPVGSNPNSGYAPTYFPGTSNGAEAQKITVASGQEAGNTDFALLPVRLAKVTGIVLSSEGKPVEGALITAQPKNMDGAGMMAGGTGRSDKNGAFTIPSVAPGDYVLQSRSLQITMSGGGDNMVFSARVGGGPDGGGSDAEVGSLPIVVTGEDLANVVLVTAKGATASGKLTFEGGTAPNGITNIRVMPVAADGDGGPQMVFGNANSVKADGSFEVKGLLGARLLRLMNVPAGWVPKSVRVNGTDITDTGMEFKPGEAVTGVEIVLTSRMSNVSGTVTGSGSEPVKDYTLVIFADDPQRWTLPNTRYVVGRRPDQNGRFEVKSLPPGSYYAAAVDYLPDGEWNDPDVLERLRAGAKRFSLDEGESKTLELKIQ
jgi:protocatechuate 3,4-dioxygenase beta subunit